MSQRDDILLHFGVKGMRWGVRKAVSKGKERVKDEIRSAKREKSWSKVAKRASSMSNEELKAVGTRIRLENDLKTLASRKEYLKRDTIPAKELEARVQRLRLEKALRSSATLARKDQQAMGQSVINLTRDVSMAYIKGGPTASVKTVISGELKRRGKRAALNKATDVTNNFIGYGIV